MKILAVLSVIVLVFTGIGIGYMYTTCNVTVSDISVQAAQAASQPELFMQLKAQVEEGCVLGTSFTDEISLGAPENYQFLIYTVKLSNKCFIPADMIELQITPMSGDVLQTGIAASNTLAPRTEGTFNATVLTAAAMHPVREINITYYMWGIPFHIRTTYGG